MKRKKPLKHPAEIGEAVTLAISLIIFTALIGYLLYSLTREETDLLPITAQAGIASQIVETGNYIIPITVKNNGPKSITYLQLDVQFDDQPDQTTNIGIDHLARNSSREVFLVTDRAYTKDQLDIRSSYYKFK